MAGQAVNITSPVGRLVRGSLYTPNTTDQDGKPLVIKTGANAGQPRSLFFFALGIAKGAERHWAETPWGSQIWAIGHAAFPQAAQSPAFAWKVEDGDSTVANLKGNKPCDNEGYPGHWIIKFSGGFAPKIYRQEGQGWVTVTEEGYVKPGYFIEVAFQCDKNTGPTPGVYLNYGAVCFRAFGPEISYGINVAEAGFGQSPLPAGASAVPLASSAPPPATAAPPAPGSAPLPPPPPAPVASAPIAVVPNPQFLQVPAPIPTQGGAAPAPVPAPSAVGPSTIPTVAPPPPAPVSPSSGLRMTAAAGALTYEAYKASGWTDEAMIAHGVATR